MSPRIVWRMADGSIAVTSPAEPPIEAETNEEFIARMMRESGAKIRPAEELEDFIVRLIALADLPRRKDESSGDWFNRMVAATGAQPIPAETVTDFLTRLLELTKAVQRPAETEDEYLDRIAAKLLEPARGLDGELVESPFVQATRLTTIDHTQLPPRKFRDCWRDDGAAPVVDLPLAKEQLLAEARVQRNKLLTASDALKARTDDLGTVDEKAAVAEYRQALRDLPELLEQQLIEAKTLDALIAFEPAFPEHPEAADALIADVSPMPPARP